MMTDANQKEPGLMVNIGAGKTFIPGFINVDIAPVADVVLNLDKDKLPFDDNSVDVIFSYHALEHTNEYLFALSEIHRVLKHGGRFLLGVPYVTLTEYNLVNPYHKQNFNEHSFDFFDANKLKGSAAEESLVLFAKVFHKCHYMGAFNLFPPFIKNLARRHLFNIVRKIDFGLVAIKDIDRPIEITNEMRKGMRDEFLECCWCRTPYSVKKNGNNVTTGLRTKKYSLQNARRWWNGTGF